MEWDLGQRPRTTRCPNWPNSGGLTFQNPSHKDLVAPLLVPNERTRPAGWLEPVSGLVVAAGLPWGLTSLLFLLQNTDLFEMIEKMQVRMGQEAPEQAGLKVAVPCLPPLCELIRGPSSQVIPTCPYKHSSSESCQAPVQQPHAGWRRG